MEPNNPEIRKQREEIIQAKREYNRTSMAGLKGKLQSSAEVPSPKAVKPLETPKPLDTTKTIKRPQALETPKTDRSEYKVQ